MVKSIVDNITACEGCYIYQEKPSLTVARNNAICHAKEDICICSDDDVDVYSNTVENVFQIMQDKKISMIAGIDDNTTGTSSKIGYLFNTKSFIKRRIGHVTKSMLSRYPEDITGQVATEWAMGYFFVIRKTKVKEWNLQWDEKLTSYAYAEDMDFSYNYYKNSQKENMLCVLDNRVRVKHLTSQEFRIQSQKETYMYVLNRIYLSYKHNMGVLSRIAIFWCDCSMFFYRVLNRNAPMDMLRAIFRGIKLNNNLKKGILLEEFYR